MQMCLTYVSAGTIYELGTYCSYVTAQIFDRENINEFDKLFKILSSLQQLFVCKVDPIHQNFTCLTLIHQKISPSNCIIHR